MTTFDVNDLGDAKACGFGQREKTCAYLTMGPKFMCGRETGLKQIIDTRLEAGTMNAKIAPTAPFPYCQSERITLAEESK